MLRLPLLHEGVRAHHGRLHARGCRGSPARRHREASRLRRATRSAEPDRGSGGCGDGRRRDVGRIPSAVERVH